MHIEGELSVSRPECERLVSGLKRALKQVREKETAKLIESAVDVLSETMSLAIPENEIFDVDRPYRVAELFGTRVLDLEERVSDEDRDDLESAYGELYLYDIRHHSEMPWKWVQVKDYVDVNYWTTVLSLEPIEVPRAIDESDWWYLDEKSTFRDFVQKEKERST